MEDINTDELIENLHKEPFEYRGKKIDINFFSGQVRIAKKSFETTIALYPGDEMLIGRGILDQVKSCFDGPNKKLTIYQ